MVEMIYDELVSSICIDIASGMHRMAKTGTLKLSDVMIPRDNLLPQSIADCNKSSKRKQSSCSSLLPLASSSAVVKSSKGLSERNDPINKSDESIRKKGKEEQKECFHNNVRLEIDERTLMEKRKKSSLLQHKIMNNDEASKSTKMLEAGAAKQPKSKNTSVNNLDVWNRIPPKDITSTCTNCGKLVGVSRFAIHLDKCMGIGNVRKSSM